MSLTGCPELQSAEMFFFVYVSNQRPFCFEIGSQTIIALLPSLFSWGKNVLNLTWSFPRFSWVSTEAIRPLSFILWQRYLQSSGFVTLCVEKSWMLENSLQRSSTDTSVHLETPWRLQELFVQERMSPSCFPQSSPAVLETILSSDIKPENTFTLVTRPWFWHQKPAPKNFWSTKVPSSLVGHGVLSFCSNCVFNTLTPLTTADIWLLSQLIATHECNQVHCKGSKGIVVSTVAMGASPTWKSHILLGIE